MSTELGQIEAALATETRYDALVDLEGELIDLLDASDLTPQAAMVHGRIVQRRGEWLRSADLFSEYSKVFPHHADLVYESALNYIDAGKYDQAGVYLDKLSAWIDDLSDAHLRGMWRAATLLGNHTMADKAHDIAKARGSSLASGLISRRIALAKANAARELPQVVSIGENCLPWMVANRWGYRTDPHAAKHQSPFNLAQTRSAGVINVLNHGIEALIEPQNLETVVLPNGTPCPHNKRFSLLFNHEQGGAYVAGDYRKVRDIYAPKIEALKGTMSERCVYLHFSETGCEPLALLDAINAHRTSSDYTLVVINLTDALSGIRESCKGKLVYRDIVLPRPDYLWFKPSDYESAEGFAFEQQLLEPLEAAIETLGSLYQTAQ